MYNQLYCVLSDNNGKRFLSHQSLIGSSNIEYDSLIRVNLSLKDARRELYKNVSVLEGIFIITELKTGDKKSYSLTERNLISENESILLEGINMQQARKVCGNK
jgi:hypothetical protein